MEEMKENARPSPIVEVESAMREERRAIVHECLLKSYPYSRIALVVQERMGLEKAPSKSVIAADAKAVMKDLGRRDFEELKGFLHLQLDKLKRIEYELWEEYDLQKSLGKSRTDILELIHQKVKYSITLYHLDELMPSPVMEVEDTGTSLSDLLLEERRIEAELEAAKGS